MRNATKAHLVLLGPALILALLLFGAGTAQATPPAQLWQTCPTGSGAAECSVPRGIAADPVSGHLYIADQANDRINEFTAWGGFVKAWGWDVVLSGPGNDGTVPEDEFENCIPARGDICKAGIKGGGRGQLVRPQGVALDSNGDLYVAEGDFSNRRVQKFDVAVGAEEEAEFMLMFGGHVNETSGGNVCPRPGFPSDVCKAAVAGSGGGEFGAWVEGDFIDIDSDDTIYVGDQNRVQKFDTEGNYLGDLPDPGGVLSGQKVHSLAVAPSGAPNEGNFYILTAGKEDVLKLDATSGVKGCTLKVKDPRALAVDAEGNLYAANNIGDIFENKAEIVQFEAGCPAAPVLSFVPQDFERSTGIATNTVTEAGGVGLYLAHPDTKAKGNSFIRAYGPPPDKWPPPVEPPDITSSYATSVSTESAVLKAQINPHFWNTTRYYVQYGTGKCSEGGCKEQPAPPGSLLTANQVNEDVTTSAVFLTDLKPDTTYHYRFIAKTTFGPGEEAEVQGEERSFHTFPSALSNDPPCPNEGLRTGPSAKLPDCRAYEMVSPPEKESDVLARGGSLAQTTPEGDKLTYTAEFAAFADPQSAPLASQYLAERDPQAGWSTNSLVPPWSTRYLYMPPFLNHYRAFSPDLCQGWFLQETDVALVPGAPEGFPSLYSTDLCGEGGYGLITPVAPPEPELAGISKYFPTLQGFSADGELSVFYANSKLTPEASEVKISGGGPIYQLYATDEAGEVHLVSVLPDGSAANENSALGAHTGSGAGGFKSDTVHHALSEDGSRAFWTRGGASTGGPPDIGRIYLRLNPAEPQSALPEGSAAGLGDLTAGSATVTNLVVAAGKGKITNGSNQITQLETSVGHFEVGHPLTSDKFPAGTKVTACTPACGPNATALTLDTAAIGGAIAKQPISSPGPAPFAAGQILTGPGIPFGTEIEAVAEGSLTLSANATQTLAGAQLSAHSECTEPEKACTIPVSGAVSEETASFKTASADGSTAIFTIGPKLYEYDTEKAIAYEPDPATLIADGVVGSLMGASEDASRFYFASEEDLGAGPNPLGDLATPGQPNLYLHERGESLSFIGTLSKEDVAFFGHNAIPTPLSRQPSVRGARISSDGLHAAFHSSASLSDYDNADAQSGHPDTEVYLYDAAAGGAGATLHCVSCNPSGGRPMGRKVIGGPLAYWTAAQIPGWEVEHQPSRALTEDGRRLFFESYDALLPGDSNGVLDVYQWEAPGKGDCDLEDAHYFEANGGCISLISSGTNAEPSRFLEASADGSDVFFETQSSLVSQDTGLVDVYDARVDGGFPGPPPLPPGCEGEACQSPPGAPEDPSPASATFKGPENVNGGGGRPSCKKGKVRRKGRCVPRKQRKARHKKSNAERRAKR